MKFVTKTIYIIMLSVIIFSSQVVAFEFTKENPKTLIGTNSKEHSIFDIKLGMSHEQAWQIINKNSHILIGIKDASNPSRIYIYEKKGNGNQGKAILYLIWKPKINKMQSITVFQDCRSYLSRNFRRLLTFEAVDNSSSFKKNFLGYANKSKITLDIPLIDSKHTTYFYDEIGFKIIHQHSSDEDKIVFAIF